MEDLLVKNIKLSLLLVLLSLFFYNSGYSEITIGNETAKEEFGIYSKLDNPGPFSSMELKKFNSDSAEWYFYFDIHYPLSNSNAELIIDGTTYYYLEHQITSMFYAFYASNEEIHNAILSANSIIFQAYDIRGYLYKWSVENYALEEWKELLGMEICESKEYESSYDNIQWGCRGNDIYYSFDLFYANGTLLTPALVTGNNLHNVFPKTLNLLPGIYSWKVWSESAVDYHDTQEGFEGSFTVLEKPYLSTYELIQWGTRGSDSFYCIDIFDEHWNMLHQAVVCGEGLHSYSPQHLGLSSGTYYWKVWSPSGYGEDGFWGKFSVEGCAGLPYYSTYEKIQWGCRGDDSFYCVDIFDEHWNMLHQAVVCGEGLHSYSPEHLGLSSGIHYWKVWSPSGYGENGFWGKF